MLMGEEVMSNSGLYEMGRRGCREVNAASALAAGFVDEGQLRLAVEDIRRDMPALPGAAFGQPIVRPRAGRRGPRDNRASSAARSARRRGPGRLQRGGKPTVATNPGRHMFVVFGRRCRRRRLIERFDGEDFAVEAMRPGRWHVVGGIVGLRLRRVAAGRRRRHPGRSAGNRWSHA